MNGVLEVPARFELADQSFADSCLTTWLQYHMKSGTRSVPDFGAGDEARTRYLHLGKVALYRMSYTREQRHYSTFCEFVNNFLQNFCYIF